MGEHYELVAQMVKNLPAAWEIGGTKSENKTSLPKNFEGIIASTTITP